MHRKRAPYSLLTSVVINDSEAKQLFIFLHNSRRRLSYSEAMDTFYITYEIKVPDNLSVVYFIDNLQSD